MPAERSRLCIVVFSGAFDRVHYALAMASAALASNRPATLFFTMGATRALIASDDQGYGWRDLGPTECGLSPLAAEQDLLSKNLAGFEELLEAVNALGGVVMVCEMGLIAAGVEASSLRRDLSIKPGGLVTFLSDVSADSSVVFV